jgi:hypothetical protein
MQSARAVLRDPRTLGVAQAAPRTAAFLAKSWATSRVPGFEGSRPTLGLAAQVLLDEVLMAAMKNPKLFPRGDDYERAGADIAAAYDMWSERGWLADPESYHENPDVPMGCMVTRERALNVTYEHLTFPSTYEPHAGEPGRDRWMSYQANRTEHAWVVRTRQAGRCACTDSGWARRCRTCGRSGPAGWRASWASTSCCPCSPCTAPASGRAPTPARAS